MIQTDKQFQEDYKNWNRESELRDYIKTLIPDTMTITPEATDILVEIANKYLESITQDLLDIINLTYLPKSKHSYNVELILEHNDNRIRQKIKKDYFINSTLSTEVDNV